MDHKQRHKRLRLLISRLNKERKRQAKKIEILCVDFIAAQRDFIERLNTISFTANFYEAITGITDLGKLLRTAGKVIKEGGVQANVTFFLRQAGSFEMHMLENDKATTPEGYRLENSFNPELVESICKSNKACSIDDMFAMGLQGNLIDLNKISAVTIPLGEHGRSLGFILIYRSSQNKLTTDELHKISGITSGLSRAIQACQVLSHSPD